MKNPLWTRNFSLLIAATTFGCMGGIVGNFALSFLVFDETGSTFASALVIAIQLIPNFLIPLLVAPWMDRFPRKPFLVFGDFINGFFYALMGIYLLFFDFSYVGYLEQEEHYFLSNVRFPCLPFSMLLRKSVLECSMLFPSQ